MFINFKLLMFAILAFISLLGFSGWQNSKVKSLENELKQAEIRAEFELVKTRECGAKLDLQSAQIRAISLDNEMIKKAALKIKEKTITKFQKIKVPVKDDKCEAKLTYYENLFKELSHD